MLIHLISDGGQAYVYDALVNRIVNVSDTLFSLLNEEPKNNSKLSMSTEYQRLRAEGLFCDNHQYVENPFSPQLKSRIDRRMSLMTLQVTKNSNLRCSYCPYTQNDGLSRLHSCEIMSEQIAFQAVDYLESHSIDSEKVNISFYGGEPTLQFPLIRKVIDYSKRKFYDKAVTFSMTTNATLLDEDMLQEMEDNEFSLLISLDGPRNVTNSNRVFASSQGSVFDTVINNINRIHDHYPKLFDLLSMNMVMDFSYGFTDVAKLFDEFPFLNEINVRISLMDIRHMVNPPTLSKAFIRDYNQYEQAFSKNMFYGIPMPPQISSKVAHSFFRDTYEKLANGLHRLDYPRVKIHPSGSCVPFEMKILVTTDGKFITCEKVNETMPVNILGDIEKGADYPKINRVINIHDLVRMNCQTCFAYSFCNACVLKFEQMLNTGDIESANRECTMIRQEYENLLRRIIQRHKEFSYDSCDFSI